MSQNARYMENHRRRPAGTSRGFAQEIRGFRAKDLSSPAFNAGIENGSRTTVNSEFGICTGDSVFDKRGMPCNPHTRSYPVCPKSGLCKNNCQGGTPRPTGTRRGSVHQSVRCTIGKPNLAPPTSLTGGWRDGKIDKDQSWLATTFGWNRTPNFGRLQKATPSHGQWLDNVNKTGIG